MVYTKKIQLIFCLALVSIVCACSPEQRTVENMQVYNGPLMEVDSLETKYSDDAVLRIKFNAGKQLEYQNGDKEFLNGVKITFFNEKGLEEAVLTANKGYQEKLSSKYRVEGNVVVTNILEKKSLYTEKLFWDSNNKKIYTPANEFVKIQTPSEILTGEGLEAAQDFSRYKILKPTGIFVLE